MILTMQDIFITLVKSAEFTGDVLAESAVHVYFLILIIRIGRHNASMLRKDFGMEQYQSTWFLFIFLTAFDTDLCDDFLLPI